MKGRVSSFQSLGAVDGPGLRVVVFLQGCPLRCVYCHNPETWDPDGGVEWGTEEIVKKVLRYRPYFGITGGVTISGGEPLLQWEFTRTLLSRLKEEGVHTVLDTSGIGSLNGAEAVLEYTDLVMCDLKFADRMGYQEHCGGKLDHVIQFLKRTEEKSVPLWIRHVIVPGLNDRTEGVREILRLGKSFSNFQGLELLPFHKICLGKYEAMGLSFPLSDYPECSEQKIQALRHFVSKM